MSDPTRPRFYEGRLVQGDKPVHLFKLTKPFPPTWRWVPPSLRLVAARLQQADCAPPDLLGHLEAWTFRYVGVEVDMTGTWVRYERC